MKLREFKAALALVCTVGAVLVVGVVFFSFSKVDAALTNTTSEATTVATAVILPEYADTIITAGETVELNGHFHNDVIVAGNNITIGGIVDGDILATGGNITVAGIVQGDVRVAGGNITLQNVIERNATVIGGRLVIEPTAEIKRDVFLMVGDLVSDGTISGDVAGSAGSATINSQISGDVYFRNIQNLRLRSGTSIAGDLIYSSAERATIDPQVIITGQQLYTPPLVEPKNQTSKFTIWWWLRKGIGLIGTILLGIIVLKLMPKRSAGVVKVMLGRVGASFGWGAIYLIVTPVVLGILLLTLIGIPLSLVGVFIFGTSLLLGKIYVGSALGKWLLPRASGWLGPMCLGVTVFYVLTTALSSLPFPFIILGTLVGLLGLAWASGGMVLSMKYGNRNLNF